MNYTEKIYTVTEINKRAKGLLEAEFSDIMLEGEISNFIHHSSGHMYFTLKDGTASIDAVFYKYLNEKLDFKASRGIKVHVKGRISIFERGGRYQIIVETMKKAGAGELWEKFLKLKEKLKKEGIFDEKYKKLIPHLPQIIGIVTSPTGAAIRDILNVIKRRFAGIEIILYPAKVQGPDAAFEITRGIEFLNKKYHQKMDVMIVGRGGGSIEDLWSFNEEIVARAIFKSYIPVISSVGHEVDFLISDFSADLRAPTPSAAAELVTKDREELIAKLKKLNLLIKNSIVHKISLIEERIKSISMQTVFKYPERFIQQKEQEVDYYIDGIRTKIKHLTENRENKLNSISNKLNLLSPQNTLNRGYSITYLKDGGFIVKNSKDIEKGILLKTIFSSGSAESKVVQRSAK